VRYDRSFPAPAPALAPALVSGLAPAAAAVAGSDLLARDATPLAPVVVEVVVEVVVVAADTVSTMAYFAAYAPRDFNRSPQLLPPPLAIALLPVAYPPIIEAFFSSGATFSVSAFQAVASIVESRIRRDFGMRAPAVR